MVIRSVFNCHITIFVVCSVAEDNENGCEMDYPVHSRPLREEFVVEDTGC
jgi:hypothetical protein